MALAGGLLPGVAAGCSPDGGSDDASPTTAAPHQGGIDHQRHGATRQPTILLG